MTVYLDHNATTPLDESVLEAMLPYLKSEYGNASSLSRIGRSARAAVDAARQAVADMVNVDPRQVVFTSGGTEANNLALKSQRDHLKGGRLALSAIEHSSVIAPAMGLQRRGYPIDFINVDAMGRVTSETLDEALSERTRMVSVMMANNETGVTQDIEMISARARDLGAIMHCDAVQAAGKLPLDFKASGAHLMTISAHKFYGPKGVGALIFDKALDIAPQLEGGGHEFGIRAGTENVAAIVGLGAAARMAVETQVPRYAHLQALRSHLLIGLQHLPGVVLFAEDAPCVPNTVYMAIPGINGEALMMGLDEANIAVATGSACSSGQGASHVLDAMGIDHEVARSAIRVSLGKDSSGDDVDALLVCLQAQITMMDDLSVSALK